MSSNFREGDRPEKTDHREDEDTLKIWKDSFWELAGREALKQLT